MPFYKKGNPLAVARRLSFFEKSPSLGQASENSASPTPYPSSQGYVFKGAAARSQKSNETSSIPPPCPPCPPCLANTINLKNLPLKAYPLSPVSGILYFQIRSNRSGLGALINARSCWCN
jgi:hypothetical protein